MVDITDIHKGYFSFETLTLSGTAMLPMPQNFSKGCGDWIFKDAFTSKQLVLDGFLFIRQLHLLNTTPQLQTDPRTGPHIANMIYPGIHFVIASTYDLSLRKLLENPLKYFPTLV